jgi:hypothetical protein
MWLATPSTNCLLLLPEESVLVLSWMRVGIVVFDTPKLPSIALTAISHTPPPKKSKTQKYLSFAAS